MFASIERIELAALWDELIAGTSRIQSWSQDEKSWSIVVSRYPEPSARAEGLRARDVEILEQALLCGVRKHVASEVGLSCSSIAVILQGCFQFMGLDCLPSRIPGLLVAAAHARHHHGSKPLPWTSLRQQPSAERTITVARPDALLAAWLAPAEHAVVRLLIEGHCYSEIAEARHTSIRTVANQVASAFRRLGVSGRAELLCLLARWSLEAPEKPQRRPPSVVAKPTRRAPERAMRRLDDGRSTPPCLSPSPAT